MDAKKGIATLQLNSNFAYQVHLIGDDYKSAIYDSEDGGSMVEFE